MQKNLSQEFLENFRKQKTEQLCPSAEREKAWDLFESRGLPKSTDERYRYIASHLFRRLDKRASSDDDAKKNFTENLFSEINAFHLVIAGGKISMERSRISGHDDFFSIKKTNGGLDFERKLNFCEKQSDPFAALNMALYAEDLFIEIRSGVLLPKPIVVHIIAEADEATFPTVHTLLQIDALECSRAEVVVVTECLGIGASFANSQTAINLRSGAELSCYDLNFSKNESLTCLNNTTCAQGADSRFRGYSFFCGEGVVRNNLQIHLNERNAQTDLYALVKARNASCIDNHTTVFHNVEDTLSNEMYRHILRDSGTVVFNGEIVVDRVAQRTRAFQVNDSLIVSNKATLHSKPQLEIFADDVKCSHGATIGKLDSEMLFYMRCRGMREEDARELLIGAFANSLLEKIENPMLRGCLEAAMV